MGKQIREILTGQNVDVKEVSHKTVFEEILESKLPACENSEPRLQHEATSLIGAGFETTRWALTVSCYHIVANPDIHNRLREELYDAIPDPEKIPTWGELSKLPFLTGCIEEGKSVHTRLNRMVADINSSARGLWNRAAFSACLSSFDLPVSSVYTATRYRCVLGCLSHASQRGHLSRQP